MQVYDSVLSLGAKNSTVYAFKRLIDDSTLEKVEELASSLKETISTALSLADFGASFAGVDLSAQNIFDSITDQVGQMVSIQDVYNLYNSTIPIRRIAYFDRELYDKAVALPEAKTVSLKYSDGTINLKHGKFKGGNTYKDFNGTLSDTNAQEQYGWVTTDSSSDSYYLFNGNNSSLIISIKDFEPEPIVEDFWPLYEKLMSKSSSESVLDDVHTVMSMTASFKSMIADLIKIKMYQLWYAELTATLTADHFKSLVGESGNEKIANSIKDASLKSHGQIQVDRVTKRLKLGSSEVTNNGISLNSAQAVITEVIEDVTNPDTKLGVNLNKRGAHLIISYQQPESVSYGVSASYDTPSPRGAQIPFTFYQGANIISLSFTLKFEINEAKSLGCLYYEQDGDSGKNDLVSIAEAAKSLTRPWELSNGSIRPKLVQVLLPSIKGVGYVTSTNFTYSGDMIGTPITQKSDDNEVNKFGYTQVDDYGYSSLEISFEMYLLEDVQLLSLQDVTQAHVFDFSEDEYYDDGSQETPKNIGDDDLVPPGYEFSDEEGDADLAIEAEERAAIDELINKPDDEILTEYDQMFGFDFDDEFEVSNISETDRITGINIDLSSKV